MKKASFLMLVLSVSLAGCQTDDKVDYPDGAIKIETLNGRWSTYEWRGHQFLQVSSYNGHANQIISVTHLCHGFAHNQRALQIIAEMKESGSPTDAKYLEEFRTTPGLLDTVKTEIENERQRTMRSINGR